MSYLFPRRRLRATDVLDPVEMNLDFGPAAEKYSGRLNAHAFNGALMKANVSVASRAYYRIGHIYRSVSPGYLPLGVRHPQAAGAGPDAAVTLLNDRSWHTLTDMELTMTTGVASLWIIGWVQYSWFDWPHSTAIGTSHLQANIQFAISVDGHIVEATILGKRESYERTWVVAKANPAWDNGTGATAFPGPGIPQPGDTPAGSGPHHAAVRFGCAYPVQPGSHTIRILYRRAPRATGNGAFSSTDYVVVYSRRLFVLESGQFPGNAQTPSTVDVSAFLPEDVISTASLGTNRATALRTAYNAVAVGALARGALRNEHLPPVLRTTGGTPHAQIASFGPTVNQSTNDAWPGYGVSTIAAAQTGVTGWWELNDAPAGNTLRVNNNGNGWNRANGTIILLGNVHVPGVITAAAPPGGEFHRFGVLTLGYNVGAAGTVIGATEAGTNSCNLLEDGVAGNVTDRQIEADVPLFFVHEPSETVLPAGSIDSFSVFGSTLDSGTAPLLVTMSWRAASLIALQLRD